MSKTLDEILNVQAANGPFGPGNAVMEQTLRDFIQLQSTLIAVGTQVVGVRTVDWLTFKWYTGVDGTFTYPVDDNAVVEPTRIGTASYEVSLAKGQGRTIFLDSTLLRGESFETLDRQQLAIVRNRADIIDDLILEKLIDGAGQSVAVASGKEWDTAAEDAESNVLSAMDKIFENGRVSGDEGVVLIVPAKARSVLLNTTLYGNVVESLADHLRRVANLTVLYSRNSRLADTALLLVPGAETAEFFQYNGPGFMETELTRIPGVGYDWILSGYMGCVIHEHQDGAAGGKNNRICKITNISA
jgi:hypothetical protein|tara:strand:+ start:2516 stop:3418 length:903 start_codon:yes stop_codon:yes gene_type:complete